MKNIFIISLIIFSQSILAQQNKTYTTAVAPKKLGFGLKAGVNFANVSNAGDINAESRTGFMAGAFLSPQFNQGQGFRSEIIFSQQGYNFKSNTNTGKVTLNYLLFPQLYTFNLGKVVQLQIGGQLALLVNAVADSLNTINGYNAYSKARDYYNTLDYGMAAGFELYPSKGMIIGARYNLSFAKTYKDESDYPVAPIPSFIPPKGTNAKNNVVQVFAGYRF
ncbi:MAG TPA: porin family protein [Flavitalea sp.]|nr:porin family protein [Flavitalea sp.]